MSNINRTKREFTQSVDFKNGNIYVTNGDGTLTICDSDKIRSIQDKISKQQQEVKELYLHNNKTIKYIKTGKIISIASIAPTIITGGTISILTASAFPFVLGTCTSLTLGIGSHALNKKANILEKNNYELQNTYDTSNRVVDDGNRVKNEIDEQKRVINPSSFSKSRYNKINSGGKTLRKTA